MQFDLFAQSNSLQVTCFDCKMLTAATILQIPSIHLLELINRQSLLSDWVNVFHLTDEFLGFYFPQAIELQPYTKVSTHVNA